MELKLNSTKKKVGRPKIPESERKQYQRIAVYPGTYALIKEKTSKTGRQIKDYIDDLVRQDNN